MEDVRAGSHQAPDTFPCLFCCFPPNWYSDSIQFGGMIGVEEKGPLMGAEIEWMSQGNNRAA
jgi:hypothetical protein